MIDISPKVSCLMITYNQENFIEETIESVLSQDYENLEIVISDDASTDKTPDILKGYQKKYPNKIKIYIQEKNVGIIYYRQKIKIQIISILEEKM